jgi:hypothetical protein
MKNSLVFCLLVAVGCIQFVGDLAHLPTLKGLGFALHASPAPKVFTSQQGFETFSNRFYVQWRDDHGYHHDTELTRRRYAGLRGPYNRRNAYGAVFSYGPILAASTTTQPMYQAVVRHAVCGGILAEVGIEPAFDQPITIRVEPRDPLSRALDRPLAHTVRCNQ